jgi:hypothetical protein
MPFIGVLPERAYIFHAAPIRDVAVSDAAAWRLNPGHRHIYDKLSLALDAGLLAAPCGVDPCDLGLRGDGLVFVKPIINLAGMALKARAERADAVAADPGCFWCEQLSGAQTSTDCLVSNGEPVWIAHTAASAEKSSERPLYWRVGAPLPDVDPIVVAWVRGNLAGYTGLCNIELIGGRPIEAHLRGSNGFFDLYGNDFVPAWAALVDGESFTPPPPPPGGYIISVFGHGSVTPQQIAAADAVGVQVQNDSNTPDRVAILRCRDLAAGMSVREQILGNVK